MPVKSFGEYFDRLEEKIRKKLSHYPILYAFIGGVGIVLFWRGVWHTADDINMGSIVSLILGTVILIMTGIFVAEFIGNKLIISGLVGEKKIERKEEIKIEKEEVEIETEETQLRNLQNTLKRVEEKLEHIDREVEEKK